MPYPIITCRALFVAVFHQRDLGISNAVLKKSYQASAARKGERDLSDIISILSILPPLQYTEPIDAPDEQQASAVWDTNVIVDLCHATHLGREGRQASKTKGPLGNCPDGRSFSVVPWRSR